MENKSSNLFGKAADDYMLLLTFSIALIYFSQYSTEIKPVFLARKEKGNVFPVLCWKFVTK
jgi:hypothetical protein